MSQAVGIDTRPFSWRRLMAMVLRYVLLFRSSWPRIFELMYWWNNFFTPLIYLNRPERMTISIGLRMFQTRDEGHLE